MADPQLFDLGSLECSDGCERVASARPGWFLRNRRDPRCTCGGEWRRDLARAAKDIATAAADGTGPIREIIAVPDLAAGRVGLERERFSGGVNLSAQERNAARRKKAAERESTCYVDHRAGVVYAAPRVAQRLRERCGHLLDPFYKRPEPFRFFQRPASFTITEAEFGGARVG